jgi:DNA-binding NarL/FixJ family response regulator
LLKVGPRGGEARSFLVVEDDLRLTEMLASVLRPPGWEPIFAASGSEALMQLRAGAVPAVALVDLGLPDIDGIELIRKMAAFRPGLPVVVLTACTHTSRILESIRAGATGYLFKEDLGRGLGAALGEAASGGAPMSPAVARFVLDQVRVQGLPSATRVPPPVLTERERQVVEQLARGLSYGQVAGVLDISANTVRTYVRGIYEKLCVCSKTEAVLAALRLGLIAASLRD